MELRKVSATTREGRGKGQMRKLRADGKIPAVAYGAELAPQALSVSPAELVNLIGSELGRNTPIELDVDGKSKLTVMLTEFQYHPVTRTLLHADFIQIKLDKPVDVDVPLELLGKPEGVVQGGVLRQVFRKLPLRCLPEKIPVKISHDVAPLKLDEHVYAKDLALPEGVSVRLPPEQTVAGVVTEKKRGYEEEEEAAAAAAAAASAASTAAAGAAAGAPAAGAAGDAGKKADAPAKK
jgi:large subunit ribosomal protein L25